MKTLKIGIASQDAIRERTLAIARGELKPGRNDPKVWFTSIESLAQVLSTKNRQLIDLLNTEEPQSLTELAELSGRAKSNLSRTLKTLESYGIVELIKGEGREIIPRACYEHIRVDYDLNVHDVFDKAQKKRKAIKVKAKNSKLKKAQ